MQSKKRILTMLGVILMLITFIGGSVEASGFDIAPRTNATYITTSGGVNIRSKATTNSNIVGKTNKNTRYTGKVVGNWVQVTHNGKLAYISRLYMLRENSQTKNFTTTSGGVNIRKKATTASDIVGKTQKGQVYKGTLSGNWVEVEYNGKVAYISQKYMKASSTTAKNYTTTSGGVNIRKGPSTSYDILGKTKINTTYSGYQVGNWIKTTHNGQIAYISQKYMREVHTSSTSSKSYQLTHNNVIIRSGPSSSSTVLGRTTRGQIYKGVEQGNWIKTTYNGKTAYVSKSYVTPVNVSTSTYQATSGGVNIRREKSSSGRIVGTTKNNQIFKGKLVGNWLETMIDGSKAYISKDYLVPKDLYNKPSIGKSKIRLAGKTFDLHYKKYGNLSLSNVKTNEFLYGPVNEEYEYGALDQNIQKTYYAHNYNNAGAQLLKVKKGNIITITDKQGKMYEYKVTDIKYNIPYSKHQYLPTFMNYAKDDALILKTCEYLDSGDRVVIAKPI